MGDESNRLAVLIATPHGGEIAMLNDVRAMTAAAQLRGLRDDEIMVLPGDPAKTQVSRADVVDFLGQVSTRIAEWKSGHVLMHYAGHGGYWSDPADNDVLHGAIVPEPPPNDERSTTPRPHWVTWQDFWHLVNPPGGVAVTFVPDA